MRLLTFLMIIESIAAYEWLEFNDKFDCVVSIVIDGKPASVGVFISTRTVLTSANPLNHVGNDTKKVLIHAVKGFYKAFEAIKIEKIANNQSNRNKTWIPMGHEATEHTSIHDIALITISTSDQIKKLPKALRNNTDKGRRPYPVKLPDIVYQLPIQLVYAGFGYLDQFHVENNTVLEVSYPPERLVDCDEWLPREWGRFICILDDQNSYSLASGAPLLEDGKMDRVYAIGCFSLKKGKDNLLVFTDLRPYVSKLYGYIEDKEK